MTPVSGQSNAAVATRRTLALVVLAIAALDLAGWWTGTGWLTDWGRPTEMKPLTGLTMLLIALGLLPTVGQLARLRALAVLLLLFSVANVTETATGLDLGIDHLVPAAQLPASSNGRMALVTTLAVVLLTFGMLAAATGRRVLPNVLGSVSLAIGFTALVGYALNAEQLYTIGNYSTVALPTAVTISAAAAGVLLWSQESTVYGLLADRGSAGRLMRVVLPALVSSAVLLGWALLRGGLAGWYSVHVTAALMTTTITAVSVAVVVHNARQVQRTEQRLEDQRLAEQRAGSAQAEAEAAMRAKSQFLSRMSHELRTPMNAVLGFGQLLEQEDLPPRQRESVDHIMRASRHLVGLLDEVLELSRLDADELSPEPVLLSEVTEKVLSRFARQARRRGIDLALEVASEPEPLAVADRRGVERVLDHLVSNAVAYNVEGGGVRVRVEPVDGVRVRLSVTDTGPGIPDDRRHLLFVPFERLGAERTEVDGTGMGLALARHLTQAMGGMLDLDSGPDGSTFWVEFPRSAEAASVEATPGAR